MNTMFIFIYEGGLEKWVNLQVKKICYLIETMMEN
jgi:hypothetical protein